ncbi:MAG: 4Fe-4S dicluster domain-containing protein [Firmicutes bacterium]|nr:4Fe-4S dicluster domain-containing protein [Bacillota bacterium]
MSRLGFVFDQTRCIGCNACQMACKDAHDLERGVFFRRVQTLEYEKHGKVLTSAYSGSCNHCEKAACVDICPTGAMHHTEDGTVGHDRSKCIGCGSCTWACPYGSVTLSQKQGCAVKCDSCRERRAEGKNPYCVDACLTHCLQFGDLEHLTKDSPREYADALDILPDPAITCPSLKIRKRVPLHE